MPSDLTELNPLRSFKTIEKIKGYVIKNKKKVVMDENTYFSQLLNSIGSKPVPGTGAIGYLRVSTTRQLEPNCISLEIQEQRIEELASSLDIPIKSFFKDEGISGRWVANRPGLAETIAALSKGDTLILYSISRLIRNIELGQHLAGWIVRKGIRILTVEEQLDTNTKGWVGYLGMFMVVHDIELTAIKDKIKDAMDTKKLKGEPMGNVTYGYHISEDKKTLVDDEYEQKVLNRISELKKSSPVPTFKSIAETLNTEGYKTRYKKDWTLNNVYNVYNKYIRNTPKVE